MEFLLLYLVSAIGLILNLLLMSLLVGQWSFPLMTAKVSAPGLVFFWNFWGRKIRVFKKDGLPSTVPELYRQVRRTS
jgi:putative flippase GtrA